MPSLLDLARARLPAQFLNLERQKARFDHQINTILGTHNRLGAELKTSVSFAYYAILGIGIVRTK